jgi:hypothetical protein
MRIWAPTFVGVTSNMWKPVGYLSVIPAEAGIQILRPPATEIMRERR